MNFILVYASPNGTTHSISHTLEDIIKKNNHRALLINIGRNPYRDDPQLIFEALKGADIVGFGSPTYHMDMLEPMQRLLSEMLSNKEKYNYKFKSFLYLTYAGITSGKALINASRVLKELGIPIIGGMKVLAPHFHHNKKYPSKDTQLFVEEFYNEIQEKGFREIQWKKVKNIFAPKKIRTRLIYPLVHIIGKKRELPINVNKEKCKKCKKCVRECPVGAIKFDGTVEISPSKCIHCYHCVIACKFEAIKSPIEKLDDMIKKNKSIIGVENPLNRIYI